jgi:predicted DCC family thiol-disulfide oxidoreductase YuxK
MERWTILYDEDCGFCRWSVDRLLRLDGGRRLRATPIRGVEGHAMLTGLPVEERLASWHLRSPSREVVSAGAAVAPLLRLLPGGRPFARIAARFPRLTERVYGWVARHRTAFGRLLGAKACDVDPARSSSSPGGRGDEA